jgi:hypothetical protein
MWRRIHFWFSLVVFLQLFLWVISGIGFSLVDPGKWSQKSDPNREPDPLLSLTEVKITAPEAVSVIRANLGSDPEVESLVLRNHRVTGQVVYEIQIRNRKEPFIVGTRSGNLMYRITEKEAGEIAARDFPGMEPVSGVEWITEEYQKGYDYFGKLPVYRVDFSDFRRSRIYVSPFTGDILARRNIHKSVFDLFWTVHVLGYVDREINGHIPLIVLGVLALICVLSGVVLHGQFFSNSRTDK